MWCSMSTDAVSAGFEVTVNHVYNLAILSVSGELDLKTAPQLTESVDAVITEHSPAALIIDLTGVPFLASMGMTVLVQTCEHLGQSTSFAVVADGPATSRPLTMMGLDHTFALYSDLDAAVTALAS